MKCLKAYFRLAFTCPRNADLVALANSAQLKFCWKISSRLSVEVSRICSISAHVKTLKFYRGTWDKRALVEFDIRDFQFTEDCVWQTNEYFASWWKDIVKLFTQTVSTVSCYLCRRDSYVHNNLFQQWFLAQLIFNLFHTKASKKAWDSRKKCLNK